MKMKFHSKKDRDKLVRIQFQTGIVVNIKSTRALYLEVKEENLSFMLTSRCNQDALENCIGQLRLMGGANSHPTAVQVISRIRKLSLIRDVHIVVKNANVEHEDEVTFFQIYPFLQYFFYTKIQKYLTG